ncbi:hypothetical protein ACFY9F_36105 [Streptomyces sp. NPDC012421]|uniref:hypothetical protein n=1 Tax=Streptomyces sp. NPDC012421 TaxID=3364832 RepID=UPI0036E641B6
MTPTHAPVALVSPRDQDIALKRAARLYDSPLGMAHALFTPPNTGPAGTISDRDHAAVGTLLSWPLGHSSPEQDTQILAVSQALGRAEHAAGPRDAPSVGVILLGGEIAARHLHHKIAHAYGPYGLEPLAAVIAHLWPLPAEEAPGVAGHPAMALHRMTTALPDTLLTSTQRRALRMLGQSAISPSLAPRLLLTARLAHEVVLDIGPHDTDLLPTIRKAVLTARITGRTPQKLIVEAP